MAGGPERRLSEAKDAFHECPPPPADLSHTTENWATLTFVATIRIQLTPGWGLCTLCCYSPW